jgi:large exoprotein involved in heme utilization and adhesion
MELNATGSITLSLSSLENFLSGQGTLGSVNLSAGDRVSLGLAGVYNAVQSTGVGNAGDINITTGSLSLSNAQLYSFTNGQGNAGSVNINARDTVSFDGYAGVYNLARSTGVGNAGDINIATGSLSLTNNATLSSFTTGQGNAGSVNINARDTVSLKGRAGLLSYTDGPGNTGSVNINAYSTISLDNSTVYNLVLSGISNASGINITTGSLSLNNGSSLYSDTLGQGNAGSVNINARDRVSLDGTSPTLSSYNPSTIFTRVAPIGVGQGGNVTITTSSLSLTNGGAVNTSTAGQGNAGRVTINARDVQISGTAPSYTAYDGEVINFPSGVTTSVRSGAVGNGGDATITTGSLSVSNQGGIFTNAQGQGRAGNIQIQASDAVSFNGGMPSAGLSKGQWVGEAILTSQRDRSQFSMALNSRLPPLEKETLAISQSVPTQLV